MSDVFSVSSGDAVCSATLESGDAELFVLADNIGTARSVTVLMDEAGSSRVAVTCSGAGYPGSSSETAVFTVGGSVAISGLDDISRSGTGVISDVFTVSPSEAT